MSTDDGEAPPMMWRVFDTRLLTPDAWASEPGMIHAYNNAILEHQGERVMAYRVISPTWRRRIALCRIDGAWDIVPGSAVPFSDHLTFADSGTVDPAYHDWVADGRLFTAGGRLYLHFNGGTNAAPNKIYLVEVDATSLLPVGPAREVVRDGGRRRLEKNWMFFEHDGDVYAVYSFSPLVILRVDFSDPAFVRCTPVFKHEWDAFFYEEIYGELRGGATPVRRAGRLYFVAHSCFRADVKSSSPVPTDLCYVAPVIVLKAVPPFEPIWCSPRPILQASDREMALPVARILDDRCIEAVFPCGAIADGEDLIISYGLNSNQSVLRRMAFRDLDAALSPVVRRSPARAAQAGGSAGSPEPASATPEPSPLANHKLKVFWWKPTRVSPRDPQALAKLGDAHFVHGNFGDLMAPHMLARLTGRLPAHPTDKGPRLFTTGDLVHRLQTGDVVWGAGMKGDAAEMRERPQHLHILATRGPITLDFLQRRGYDTSRVSRFFDPGCLIATLFPEEIQAIRGNQDMAREPFIIIPHYRDLAIMREKYPGHAKHIRSTDTPFFELVGHIIHSELVISSSLRGIIIAEALGVPAIWHAPMGGENELKFTDYYLGTDRWKILRVDHLAAALRASPMPLPRIDGEAIIASFPSPSQLKDLGVLVPA